MHVESLVSFQAKQCSGLTNTGSSSPQTNYPYDVSEYALFQLSRIKACDKRLQALLHPVARQFTTHQHETVSPVQNGTWLTEPMNAGDNGLHRYVPT